MLVHSAAPQEFWAEALATATYLVNRRPCRTTGNATPYSMLFGVAPSYNELRVFGCRCFPNITATTPHKLATRSTTCVFLGYPADHRGYRCYDVATDRVITSRHVVFDEDVFPFRVTAAPSNNVVDRPSASDFDDDTPPPGPPAHRCRPLPPRPTRARTVRHGGTPADTIGNDLSTPRGPGAPSAAPSTSTSSSSSTSSPTEAPAPTSTSTTATTGHHMVTRARDGIYKPNPKYALAAAGTISPVPRSVCSAVKDPN
jgi:histone deacetylase 1/2